jgi:cytochrome c peroxidase
MEKLILMRIWKAPAKYSPLIILVCMLISLNARTDDIKGLEEVEPAEIRLGERLFMETRFAHSFYQSPGGHDPALDINKTTRTDLPGAFAGGHMNCRACHMVDEHSQTPHAGMRAYADFARRAAIPERSDGQTTTPRNSQQLVNIAISARKNKLFHFDGRFSSMGDLVKATLTGRNYGWLAHEEKLAIKHIARVVKNDTGISSSEDAITGAYKTLLKATDQSIPAQDKLPLPYRIDIDTASDMDILNAISTLIAVYVNQLEFSRDEDGLYNGSPYDQFLIKNQLPRKPSEGQTALEYGRNLLLSLNQLDKPAYIRGRAWQFKTHKQRFRFGPLELAGVKIFLTEKQSHKKAAGNCISCHAPPEFTDFNFHNTAVSQIEYDQVHQSGTFMKLDIPDLASRNDNFNDFLPATSKHPQAEGPFLSIPERDKPQQADLGLWNVFDNPDSCTHQTTLENMVCKKINKHQTNKEIACTPNILLENTIALFKTPGIRDLGHSSPYMHNGMFDSLEAVTKHYMEVSALARAGKVRNAAPELSKIHIQHNDIKKLTAFMKALNEDYD